MLDTPQIEPAKYETITDLAALRALHSRLLQRQIGRLPGARLSSGEMLGFIQAAAAAGRQLAKPDEREVAQGIMDYWVATLLSQEPRATEIVSSFQLEPFDEAAASEAGRLAADIREAAERAARDLQQHPVKLTPAEAQLLSRLLSRLVRLKESSLEAFLVPLSTESGFLDEPGARPLAEQLVNRGLLRRQNKAKSSYVLAHELLLTQWAFLQDYVRRRRALRELARGWEKGGKTNAALLSGGRQIEQSSAYGDLDKTERAFVDASLSQNIRVRRTWQRMGVGAVVLLAALAAYLAKKNDELARVNAALVKVSAEKDRVNDEKDQVNLALTQKISDLNAANANLKEANDSLRALEEQHGQIIDATMASEAAAKQRAEEEAATTDKLRADFAAFRQSAFKSPQTNPEAQKFEQTLKLLDTNASNDAQQIAESTRAIRKIVGWVNLPAVTVLAGARQPVSDARFIALSPPEVVAGTVGASAAGATHLWAVGGQALQTLPGDAAQVRASPDGQWFVTVQAGTSFHAYSRRENWQDRPLGKGRYTTAAFSPNGRWLAAGNAGRTELWDWQGQPGVQPAWQDPTPFADTITSLVFSPTGRWLAAGSDDNSFSIHEMTTGSGPAAEVRVFWPPKKLDHPVQGLAFSADSRSLLVRLTSGLKVFSLNDPNTPPADLPHNSTVRFAEFNPDDRWIASVADDGTLSLWHQDAAAKWQRAAQTQAHHGGASVVGWSPDGKYLATGGADGIVRVWSAGGFDRGATPQPVMELPGVGTGVRCLRFSADSRYLVGAGGEEVRVWDLGHVNLWQTGRFKSFGGPTQSWGDGLAIVQNWAEADATGVFLANADRSAGPGVRQLDPDKYYVAARWRYTENGHNRAWLLKHKVQVCNLRTGAILEAQPVNWGPNESTGKFIDLSPGLVRALGLRPDDVAGLYVPN